MGNGPRALALGFATTATASDVTAIGWNPAGLTFVTHTEVAFAMRSALTRTVADVSNPSASTLRYKGIGEMMFGSELVEFVGIAVPFRIAGRPVTGGIAWRQFAAGARQGRYQTQIITTRGRYTMDATYTSVGGPRALSPSLAVAVTDKIRLGVTANFLSGAAIHREIGPRTFTVAGTTLALDPPYRSVLHERGISGLAISAGALVEVSKTVRLGIHAVLPHERRMTLDNDTTRLRATLTAPMEVAAGVVKRIGERSRLSFDLRNAPWSASTFHEDLTGNPIVAEVGVANARSFHLGLERDIVGNPTWTAVRFGAFHRRASGRDFDGAGVSDIGLSIGEGRRFGRVALDYGLLFTRSSTWTRSERSDMRVRLTNNDFVLSAGLRRGR